MPRFAIGCLLLAATAAGCTYPEDAEPWVGEREAAIVNGTQDSGHPQVGLLYIQGTPSCTATLVGSRTVLTAAHCVTDDKQPPFQLVGPISFKLGDQMYLASSTTMHPGYSYNGTWNADVAVIRLGQAVQGVIPARIAKTAPAKGETVTLVGFGYTSDAASSSFGVKRRATNTIGAMTQNLITFYGASGSVGNICFGDSGGPAFAVRGGVEYLVGVHSYGEGACGVTEHDQRADFYRPWIEQQAQGDLYTGSPSAPPPGDTKAPTVQFLTPRDNNQLAPSFQVQVAAQDDVGVARVELFVDGKQSFTKAHAPYQFSVQSLAGGAHTLRAEAVDQAGHRTSSMIQIVVRDGLSSQTPADSTGATTTLSHPAAADEGQLLGSCSYGPVGRPPAAPTGLFLLAGLLLVLRVRP